MEVGKGRKETKKEQNRKKLESKACKKNKKEEKWWNEQRNKSLKVQMELIHWNEQIN